MSDLTGTMDPLALAPAAGAAASLAPMVAPRTYARFETQIHAQQCALHLGSLGGRTAARRWCAEKGFGDRHTATVLDEAAKLLVAGNRETLDQTRARLVTMLETELEDAQNGVVFNKKGEPIVVKDRSAIAQFTRLIVTLTGLDQVTINHVQAKDRPLREMTTEQLLAEEAKLGQEIADRLPVAEATVLTSSADQIPLDEKTPPVLNPTEKVGNLDGEPPPAWVQRARDSGLSLRVRAQQYGTV